MAQKPRRRLGRGVRRLFPAVTITDEQRRRITAVWHSMRVPMAWALALSGFGFGLAWRWPGGNLIAVLALAAALHSMYARRVSPTAPPVVALAFEITAVFLGMAVAAVPDAALGLPFLYLATAALLMLRPRVAAPLLVYASLWYVAFVRDWLPIQTTVGTDLRITVTGTVVGVIFTGAILGLVSHLVFVINQHAESQGAQLKWEQALSGCSGALLRGGSDDPVGQALKALLGATTASAVFVEVNVDDPEHGLCASLYREATQPDVDPDPPGFWELVPWSEMPEARRELEAGRPYTYDLDAVSGVLRERYEAAGIESELNIPIFVGTRWHGLVGFTDIEDERDWTGSDHAMLRTAAELFGAYFEAEQTRGDLESTVGRLDEQATYQHALAECSAALLSSTGSAAVDAALTSLLSASNADYIYVDTNYEDPELGLCARVIHDAERPGSPAVRAQTEWWGGPYSDLPTAFEALSQGLPVHIITSRLEGAERKLYEDDGLKAELCLPINVNGKWFGSVAFADYVTERSWGPAEVRALRTAAEMIGAFWERTQAKERLETMVDSLDARLRYEEAISACSQALLISDDETAIDTALGHLLEATGAHNVFVDANVTDPALGLCGEVTHEAIRPGYEDIVDEEIWIDPDTGETIRSLVPYDALPHVRDLLAQGRPAVVLPRTLEPAQRSVYGDGACKTELNIPIMVGGEWQGSVGFSDFIEERHWHPDEIRLLQAVAGMIGAVWSRNRSRRQLEELVRSKDQFVAAVSHELRTPLTTVVGLSHEIRDHGDELPPEDVSDFVGMIAEQSGELSDIVDDLLVAARLNTNSLVVDIQPVDLRTEVETVMRTAPTGLRDAELSGNDLKVAGDPMRIRQVVRNLLVNVDRYGGEHVEITVSKQGPTAYLTVADDGPGVSAERADVIFEPYERDHEVSSQPASVGLGLTVARDLARLMGGDLWYDRRGDLSRFTLALPIFTEMSSLHRVPGRDATTASFERHGKRP